MFDRDTAGSATRYTGNMKTDNFELALSKTLIFFLKETGYAHGNFIVRPQVIKQRPTTATEEPPLNGKY